MLRQQGKIIYAGASNFAGWHLATAVLAAQRLGILGMVSDQSKFSLDCRFLELEVLPACRHFGIAQIPWSPLGGGILAGAEAAEKMHRRATNPEQLRKFELFKPNLEKWDAFCHELGEKPADVALAWQLHVPGITAPIIGPRTMQQFDDSLRALSIKLSPAHMQQIDAIWPPLRHTDAVHIHPNRTESPEAYAW